MRVLVTATVCFSFALTLAAEAQTARLPRKSTSEHQVEDINRNIQLDRRLQSKDREIQIQNNRFRQDLDRQKMFSAPPIGTSYGRCPPGGIRC